MRRESLFVHEIKPAFLLRLGVFVRSPEVIPVFFLFFCKERIS